MTAEELIAIVREDLLDDASDAVAGYDADARWSDAFLLRQVGEAQRQACYRHDLRHFFDDTTADLCAIALTAGVAAYALDRRILRLEEVRYDYAGAVTRLEHSSRARLEERGSNWRAATMGTPRRFFVQGRPLTLYPPPVGGTLRLSVWREPLEDPGMDDDLEWDTEPERLGHWVAYKAFGMPDEDLYNPKLAQWHLEQFAAAFGETVSARVRSSILADPPSLWLGPLAPYDGPSTPREPFDIET